MIHMRATSAKLDMRTRLAHRPTWGQATMAVAVNHRSGPLGAFYLPAVVTGYEAVAEASTRAPVRAKRNARAIPKAQVPSADSQKLLFPRRCVV